jgi:uncharacterized membrane protein
MLNFSSRILIKSITWRVTSILLGFAVSLLMGFPISSATRFTVIFNIAAFVAYYVHELIWKQIRK